MSIEPRDGVICVFMPPVERLEDYLDLIAAIEQAARTTGCSVHIEGYPPPPDPRLNMIHVTPDPGVIEVNIHPANNWRQAVDTTTILYEEARAVPARYRQIHDRRPPHRHRRRQSRGARRRHPGRLAVPAAARSAAQPGALLAAASVAVLSLLRPVRRTDQPGARGWTRPATTDSTNWRSPSI